MKSKKIVASVACAVAAMTTLSAQAIEIYPVDHARFMTNARFDFKVELEDVTARDKITVEINGKNFNQTLSGKELWLEKEEGVNASALILRDTEIKNPGLYTVTVKAGAATKTVNWDVYTTADKPKAKNVILLLADGLSVGHRTAARGGSKGVTNGMYNAP